MFGIAAGFRAAIVGATALMIGIAAATAQNHTANHRTYTLNAGLYGGGVPVNAFMPETIQVHRGDQIRWNVSGPHNIHLLSDSADPNFLMRQRERILLGTSSSPNVGQPINPYLATVVSGALYTGGDANSGIVTSPASSPAFSLIVDVEPGTYTYRCDIHREMTGVIEVVAPDVEIPSPDAVHELVLAQVEAARPTTTSQRQGWGFSVSPTLAAPTEEAAVE